VPWDSRIARLLERFPALKAIGNTPMVPVDILRDELPEVEVLAKMERLNPGGSLKDRPVLRMLLSALDDGRLAPGKTVLDSSSGNAGIAYAMVGRVLGVPVEIIMLACRNGHTHPSLLLLVESDVVYGLTLGVLACRRDSHYLPVLGDDSYEG
jgi:threonine synthase